jgi:hypothetical protein
MGDCTCGRWRRYRRGRENERGPHHKPHCAMWFDPTRIPEHAQQQLDDARTDSEYRKALLDWDLMTERCD